MTRFFPLKDKDISPSCKIYQVGCMCKDNYISETVRNVVTRLDDHNKSTHDSELAHYLKNQ